MSWETWIEKRRYQTSVQSTYILAHFPQNQTLLQKSTRLKLADEIEQLAESELLRRQPDFPNPNYFLHVFPILNVTL